MVSSVEACIVNGEYFRSGIGLPYGYQSDCGYNELIGIYSRHKLDVQCAPADVTWGLLKGELHRIADTLKSCGPVKLSFDEFLACYDGSMRKRYEDAYRTYLRRGIHRSDAAVESFIKMEKIPDFTHPTGMYTKLSDPRMIHPRKSIYNMLLGMYLKPVEKNLKHIKHFGLPMCMKGLNLKQRAEVFLKGKDMVGDCDVYMLDCSRFDGHVTNAQLDHEHSVYRRIYGKDAQLDQLLSWQHNTKCKSKHGHSYLLNARCSGDVNTSLGNSILMMAMTLSYVRRALGNNKKWMLFDDGDDAVLLVRKGVALDVNALSEHFMLFGHKLTLDKVENFYDLEFCRAKLFKTLEGWTFVRDPRRVLGGMLTIYKHFRHEKVRHSYFKQILTCESHVSAHIPLVADFIRRCLGLYRDSGHKFSPKDFDYWQRKFVNKGVKTDFDKYTDDDVNRLCSLWNIDNGSYMILRDLIDNYNGEFLEFHF